MRGLSIAIFALVAFVGAAACGPASSRPSDDNCVAKRGCPAEIELPACTEADLKDAVPAQTAVRELVGAGGASSRTVHAKLVQGNTMCTLLGCVDSKCCNRCEGGLALEMGSWTGSADNAHRIRLSGDNLSCKGDRSATCCSYKRGARVVARVDLSTGPIGRPPGYSTYYRAENTQLVCELSGDVKVATAPPLRVPVPTIDCDEADREALSIPEDPAEHAALLTAADPAQIGDIRSNTLGCLGHSIVKRGRSIAPALLEMVNKQTHTEFGAAFVLAHACQIPLSPRRLQNDRKRFVIAVKRDCLGVAP